MISFVSFIKWCVKAGIAVIVSVALLSLFTLLYSNSGVHIGNPTLATDYCWEPNQYKANMSEGFSWLRMDSKGFNNQASNSDEVDILLLGSSHMEAVNVAKDENVGVLLNQQMPEYSTYNIGISGHTIYHCVNDILNAVKEYGSAQYIVIETDRVNLTEDDMMAVIEGKYPHIPSYNSGLMYNVQKFVPAVLPIYRQVKNWRSASVGSSGSEYTSSNDDMEVTISYSEVTLNKFLRFLKENAGERNVIIVYHPATAIDNRGEFIPDSSSVDVFQKACVQNEIYFVSMEEDFKKLYEDEKILAHGFSNTAVGKGHLNKYGHALIADKIEKVIKELENVSE